MELVINRKRWGRGGGDGRLLDSATDQMCCLGFAGRICGIAKGALTNVAMPSSVASNAVKRNKEFWNKLTKLDRSGVPNDTQLANDLAGINDDSKITDTVREKKIIAKFKKIGVAVTFKN